MSKITTGLALVTACGALNSCSLFGGGKYSSQTEVETDVPESLEQGKPSEGPAAGQSDPYVATNGVPPTSNLAEAPAPYPSSTDLPALPGAGTPYNPPMASGATTGGASLTNLPADSSRGLIDIPKPEFSSVSVHNTRPPAEMLSLGPPLKPAPRMSLGNTPPARASAAGVTNEKPASPALAATDSEIAGAPKAVKSAPGEDIPAVPLLLSGARLSDFYQSLHQPVFESPVVENEPPAESALPAINPPPAADELSVPPPPPSDPGQ